MRKFFTLAKVCLLVITTMFANIGQSQTIAWNFTDGTANPSTTTANVTSSALVQGNNNGATTFITAISVSSGYTGASGTNNAGLAARTGPLVTGASGSAYVEFTLTPAAGYVVTLNAVNFGVRSTSTGPTAYTVRSNQDGYTLDLATGTIVTTNTPWALKTNTGLSAASAVGTPITFRIYGYSGSGTASANTANFRFDDISLSVTAAVPVISNNADLSSLTTSAGALSPPFVSTTTQGYSTSVGNATSSATISFTKANANSTVTASLNGGSFGNPLVSFPLNEGANNTIDVKVVAQDGVTAKTYTLTIFRAAAATPLLSVTSLLTNFGNVCTNTIINNSFTLDGSSLDASNNIHIAALPGFTYSLTSVGTYTNTLDFSYSGGAFTGKQVFVKFSPTAVQSYSDNIAVNGGGAAVTIPVSAAGVNTMPTVITGGNIVAGTAGTVSGSISAAGCTTISSYGFEYSTTNGFANGTGIPVTATNLSSGGFSKTISGLAAGTTYYYKAFATNNAGTAYGSQNTFVTSNVVPVIINAQPLLRYTENFNDITNWTANFASGIGANHFSSVDIGGSTSIPSPTKITTSSAAFSSSTSGGVQKGTGAIVLLATGSTDNTASVAIDFYMDFTGVNAGTLSFDWSAIANSTGNRNGSLRVYASNDGVSFTELSSADVLNFTNNVPLTGTVNSIALPASFNNSPTARLRFYYHNGTGGTTGSRPKISIDNLIVTGVASTPCATPAAAPTSLTFGTITETTIQGSFVAASPAPNEYLVVMSENSSLTSNPIDGQTYVVGDNVGDGTVIAKGTDLTFTATDLTGASTYFFFVFPINSVCTNGPKYLTANVLTDDANTAAGLPSCTAPAGQATGLVTVSSINSIQGSFTATAADEYLVLQSTSASLSNMPVNGVTYNAGAVLGNATVAGRSNAASFTASGLNPSTQYYYFVFSINSQGCVNGPVYNTVLPLSGSATTLPLPVCVTPAAQPANISFNSSNNSVTATFNAAGSGYNYLVVMSTSSTLSGTPVDNTDYAIGSSLGGGTVISNNSSTSFIANSLSNSTTYYFFVFSANKNCTGGTKYLITSPLTGNATTTNAPVNNYYFGNLHAHSDYSDGNKDHPGFTPADDYNYALGSLGMDFLGISEHNHFSSLDNPGNEIANYHLGVAQAAAFNASHTGFLALYGMEWGVISGGGHVVVYGDGLTDLFGWESNVNGHVGPNYDVYVPKSTYLGTEGLFKTVNDYAAKNAFASLAHPNNTDFNNLSNVPYDASADSAISGVAVESGPATSTNTSYSNPASPMFYLWYYQKLLAKGYHLGPTIDHDNHNTTFGRTTPARTAVIAPALTQSDIIKAVHDMHFYATEDIDARVDFTINTRIMGSIFEDRNAPSIAVNLTDATTNTSNALIRVMFGIPGSGVTAVVIDSVFGSSLSYVDNALANHATGYYYIDITNGGKRIVTSPIWYTRTCASSSDTTATVCDSFNWYGTVYTTSTTASKVFTTTGGCDSTVTLHLTITNSPASATIALVGSNTGCPGAGVAFTANSTDGGNPVTSYQWLKDGNPVATTTAGNYTALASGNYSVKAVTAANCFVASNAIAATVVDNTAPVPDITNLPVISGQCSASIISTPTATDNCAGIIHATTTDPTSYSAQGVHTIHWTYNDGNGNTSSQDQTVIVHDDVAPVPDVTTLPVISGQCSASVAVPTATDNCAGTIHATTTDPTSYNAQGTYTIHWTYNDGNGNTSAQDQTVIVSDVTAPAITTPVAINVNNDAGKCGATITVTAPSATDACGVASTIGVRSDGLLLSDDYPVGSTTITWRATDVNGNFSTALQTVTVTDTQKPTITAVPNQVLCITGGTYTIPVLTATDNCGSATVSYSITGATTRTGTTNDASGSFNLGISTIKWTVKDASNNIATDSTTVTINPLPAATITASDADAFCNKLTLTASSGGSGATYQWMSGTAIVGTTQQISLGQANGDGIYQLYVTVNGCTSAAAGYNFQKQNIISSYTILGYKEVKLDHANTVASGSVGVISNKGQATIGENSKVNSAGSFVKAVKIDINKTAIVALPIYAAATPGLPTMVYNTANTKSLPNYEVKSGTVTLSGNYGNLNIKKGSSVTLTGTTFGTIHTEEGAQLTFTQPTVSIDELHIDKGPSTGYTYVHFAANSKILVSKAVKIGDQVYLNPENNKVSFYVGTPTDPKKDDDDWGDDARFEVNGKDIKVTANVMMLNGKLKVSGGDDNNDSKKVNTYINMTGLYIASEVESDGKNVIWNSFDCSAPPVVTTVNAINQSTVAGKETVTSEEELKVTVSPNPTATYFTLKIESKYETPVTMRVMDSRGRVVDARSKIGSNSTIQIGHNYASGTYYAEMLQGTQRKVVQLVKVRG